MVLMFLLLILAVVQASSIVVQHDSANFYNNTITYGNVGSPFKVAPFPDCQPVYDALYALNRPWTCVNSRSCQIIWAVYENDLVLNWVNIGSNGANTAGDFTCTLPGTG
jgi:hypothetical protein